MIGWKVKCVHFHALHNRKTVWIFKTVLKETSAPVISVVFSKCASHLGSSHWVCLVLWSMKKILPSVWTLSSHPSGRGPRSSSWRVRLGIRLSEGSGEGRPVLQSLQSVSLLYSQINMRNSKVFFDRFQVRFIPSLVTNFLCKGLMAWCPIKLQVFHNNNESWKVYHLAMF